MRLLLRGLTALAMIALCTAPAQAAWPERPIHVIVPYPPGGPSDIVLRAAAVRMQVTLGQPIVLDNKPGAGGNIGAAEAARSPGDGYHWFWATDNVVTINPHVYRNLGFRPETLQPVAVASSFAQILVCNPAAGIRTVADLIKKAKASRLSYASGGAGVPGHLAMELLATSAGIEMQHIPYKGPAPAMQDVIGGQVPCGFLAGPTVLPHVRSGRLVALAVSGAHRSAMLPDVPTVAESGFPGFDATFLLVLFAPPGVPASIVARFRDALLDALKAPDVMHTLELSDQAVVGSGSQEATSELAAISKKWGTVIQRIGLHLD